MNALKPTKLEPGRFALFYNGRPVHACRSHIEALDRECAYRDHEPDADTAVVPLTKKLATQIAEYRRGL